MDIKHSQAVSVRDRQSALDLEAFRESLSLPTINQGGNNVPNPNPVPVWIHNHHAFSSWLQLQDSLLWITGPAGCGKSVIMKYILHRYLYLSNENDDGGKNITVSFFFSGAHAADLHRTRLGCLQSIIYQLSSRFPDVFAGLRAKFHAARAVLPSGEPVSWSARELVDAIKSALPQILRTHSLRFLIDGIDACGDDGAQKLLQDFRVPLDNAKIKSRTGSTQGSCCICFSSRPLDVSTTTGDLERFLAQSVIRVNESIGADIEGYVRRSLCDTDKATQDTVIACAGHIFLAASILVEIIRLGHDTFPLLKSTLPGGPMNLLRCIFNNLAANHGTRTLTLMTWVCFATRPLTLSELRVALAHDGEKGFADDTHAWGLSSDGLLEQKIRLYSAGLVEVTSLQNENEKVIQPIHALIREFMVSEGLAILSSRGKDSTRSKPSQDLLPSCHFRLATSCIRYLTSFIRQKQQHSMKWDGLAAQRPEFRFASYAATSWPTHVAHAGKKGGRMSDILKLLAWPSDEFLKGLLACLKQLGQSDHIVTKAQESSGLTWLHYWATYGLHNLLLLATRDFDKEAFSCQDGWRRTPLHLAVTGGHLPMVVLLLKKGADPRIKTKEGQAALHLAALQSHAGFTEALLEHGADVDARNTSTQTPLQCAVLSGHAVVVKLLLERGAHVDALDNKSCSALMYAAETENMAGVRVLLNHAASVWLRDGAGRNSVDISATRKDHAILRILLDQAVKTESTGLPVRTSRSASSLQWRSTALFAAIGAGNPRGTQLLLEYGSKKELDSRNRSGSTPLVCSIQLRHTTIARLLLEAGAEVNAADAGGWTALMAAAVTCDVKCIKMLLDRDADVAKRNVKGHAAIWYLVSPKSGSAPGIMTKEAIHAASLLFKRYKNVTAEWDAEWTTCYQVYKTVVNSSVKETKTSTRIDSSCPLKTARQPADLSLAVRRKPVRPGSGPRAAGSKEAEPTRYPSGNAPLTAASASKSKSSNSLMVGPVNKAPVVMVPNQALCTTGPSKYTPYRPPGPKKEAYSHRPPPAHSQYKPYQPSGNQPEDVKSCRKPGQFGVGANRELRSSHLPVQRKPLPGPASSQPYPNANSINVVGHAGVIPSPQPPTKQPQTHVPAASQSQYTKDGGSLRKYISQRLPHRQKSPRCAPSHRKLPADKPLQHWPAQKSTSSPTTWKAGPSQASPSPGNAKPRVLYDPKPIQHSQSQSSQLSPFTGNHGQSHQQRHHHEENEANLVQQTVVEQGVQGYSEEHKHKYGATLSPASVFGNPSSSQEQPQSDGWNLHVPSTDGVDAISTNQPYSQQQLQSPSEGMTTNFQQTVIQQATSHIHVNESSSVHQSVDLHYGKENENENENEELCAVNTVGSDEGAGNCQSIGELDLEPGFFEQSLEDLYTSGQEEEAEQEEEMELELDLEDEEAEEEKLELELELEQNLSEEEEEEDLDYDHEPGFSSEEEDEDHNDNVETDGEANSENWVDDESHEDDEDDLHGLDLEVDLSDVSDDDSIDNSDEYGLDEQEEEDEDEDEDGDEGGEYEGGEYEGGEYEGVAVGSEGESEAEEEDDDEEDESEEEDEEEDDSEEESSEGVFSEEQDDYEEEYPEDDEEEGEYYQYN